mgnify:CR=1 FL=1
MAQQQGFGLGGFLIRWIIAMILVIATFNPTAYSFVNWVFADTSAQLPFKALAGLVLLIGYVIYLRATFNSIGLIGTGLISAVFAVLVWILFDQGWLDPNNAGLLTWIVLVAIGTVLGIGMSWSHVRRRLSGQADVDTIDG